MSQLINGLTEVQNDIAAEFLRDYVNALKQMQDYLGPGKSLDRTDCYVAVLHAAEACKTDKAKRRAKEFRFIL